MGCSFPCCSFLSSHGILDWDKPDNRGKQLVVDAVSGFSADFEFPELHLGLSPSWSRHGGKQQAKCRGNDKF